MIYKKYMHRDGRSGAVRMLQAALFGFIVAVSIFSSGCVSSSIRYVRPSYQKSHPPDTAACQAEKNKDQVGRHGNADLRSVVDSYIGVPYRYGGTSRRGMDCSGFVWRVYTDLGVTLIPRVSSEKMSEYGTGVSRKEMRTGDLVFFRRRGRINHVGIYMGDNRFVHASSQAGVSYTTLDSDYFRNRLVCIRRVQ